MANGSSNGLEILSKPIKNVAYILVFSFSSTIKEKKEAYLNCPVIEVYMKTTANQQTKSPELESSSQS